MPFTGNADLNTIFAGMAAWENLELQQAEGAFRSYAHYPTQTELEAITFGSGPLAMHVMINGRLASATIGETEDERLHTFHTYLALAKDVNDMSSAQAKVQRWVELYRVGLKKHRQLNNVLAAPNNGTLISGFVGPLVYEFGVWDVFGMNIIGVRFPLTVRTRHAMAVGN